METNNQTLSERGKSSLNGDTLTSGGCRYTLGDVIKGFKDRRLKRLYEQGDQSKIQPELIKRVEFILALLDAARCLDDIAIHSLHLHPLKGEKKGFFAVTVRANWRIVFRVENETIVDVEMIDYH